MSFVIVDGTGTYRVGKVTLKPGANEVEDEEVLEMIRKNSPNWVTIQEDRTPKPPEPEPVVEVPREPYETFKGRDGKWYFLSRPSEGRAGKQSDAFETEEQARAAADAARDEADKLIPLAQEHTAPAARGTMTKADLRDDFACRDCGRAFRDAGARDNHERIMHPGLADKLESAEEAAG
jgi:hypothetical protein